MGPTIFCFFSNTKPPPPANTHDLLKVAVEIDVPPELVHGMAHLVLVSRGDSAEEGAADKMSAALKLLVRHITRLWSHALKQNDGREVNRFARAFFEPEMIEGAIQLVRPEISRVLFLVTFLLI